ncbi:MAG: hypothetical protein KJZ70_08705 [Bryobacterales bacterium]|nr:hypothetical protein [Bryobacterales bacterium]
MANFDGQLEQTEQRFSRLCRAYGRSAVIPEASVNFSANMWEAIEARRSSRLFGMVAKLVTTSALAATILFGTLPTSKAPAVEPEYLTLYIDHSQAPVQTEIFSSILDAEDSK